MRLVCVCEVCMCKVLWRCNAGVTPVHALHLCDMESILGFMVRYFCVAGMVLAKETFLECGIHLYFI